MTHRAYEFHFAPFATISNKKITSLSPLTHNRVENCCNPIYGIRQWWCWWKICTYIFIFVFDDDFIHLFIFVNDCNCARQNKIYKMQFTSQPDENVFRHLELIFVFRWVCSLSFELIEAIDFKSWQPRMHDLNSFFSSQRIFQELRALHTRRHMSTTTATETHKHDYYYRRTWQIAFSDVDNLYMSELES